MLNDTQDPTSPGLWVAGLLQAVELGMHTCLMQVLFLAAGWCKMEKNDEEKEDKVLQVHTWHPRRLRQWAAEKQPHALLARRSA
jgi:hypothetical protein